MGLMRRLSMIFRSKASRALDAAEDPRETLDYSYERQARQALSQNREDLAREALTRRAAVAAEHRDLQVQRDQLSGEEDKLVEASRRLEAKVQAFRTRKETIKATYTAAEAQT